MTCFPTTLSLRPCAQPENRFGRGNQLKMRRTPSPWFEFNVTVVDLTYNETRRGWDYQVRDDSTKLVYPNWVAEKDLKR